MSEFIEGARTMQKTVFYKLSPLLASLDYGPHAIASIFKEVGLLDTLTDEDIERLKSESTIQFRQQEKAKYYDKEKRN